MEHELENKKLIYNWDNHQKTQFNTAPQIKILDTTLRDGLQDPAITNPTIEEKLKLIELLDQVGIEAADIGFPVNSKEHQQDVITIAKHIKKKKLKIKPCVLARTQTPDIIAAAEVSQAAGIEIEAITIVGSSKVRHLVETWDRQKILQWIDTTVKLGVENNLKINFLCEDGTRSNPQDLNDFYLQALKAGAHKLTIADTVGAISPLGTWNIVNYIKKEIVRDKQVTLDWHGHNDRDLGTTNALVAAFAGARRIHTTTLGIGERAGNTSLEGLLINTQLLNMTDKNMLKVKELAHYAADIFKIRIPENYPGVGNTVHSTSVGIHASAIMKARNKNII